MLQDPERSFEEWSETIKAPNLDTARGKCELIASRVQLTEVINVTQKTQTPDRNGNYKFICWFRGEVEDDGSGR